MPGPYDDSLRLQFLSLRDGLLTQFQASGLKFSESIVTLVYGTYTAADQMTGAGGAFTESGRTVISPRPTVDRKTQYRWSSGVAIVVGDARVVLSRAYSEEQIRSATWVEIDGVRFTLAAGDATVGMAGGLERAKNGLDWSLTLNLMRQRAIEPTPL
jgi:hypothetical protein